MSDKKTLTGYAVAAEILRQSEQAKAPSELAPVSLLDDAVRHRKKARKKKHAFILEYVGEHRDGWYHQLITKTKTMRYETRSAAEDALEGWRRGRGIYGFICKPNEWKPSII